MAEIAPEQFDEWVEMNAIVPFGDEKLALVMALGFTAIVNRLNRLAASWGAKDLKDAEVKHFLPWQKSKRKRQSNYTSPNQAVTLVRMWAGTR